MHPTRGVLPRLSLSEEADMILLAAHAEGAPKQDRQETPLLLLRLYG